MGSELVTDGTLADIADELATYRRWDFCAFIDERAAERAFGAGRVEPGLASCTFRGDPFAAWVSVDGFPMEERDGLATFDAGGKTFYADQGHDGSECHAWLPVNDRYAVNLKVRDRGRTSGEVVCQVVERYVSTVAARWSIPPAQAHPILELATKDPCASARELARTFTPETRGLVLHEVPVPGYCWLSLGQSQDLIVGFSLEARSSPGDSREDVESVTVAGLPATEFTGDPSYPCALTIRFAPVPDDTVDQVIKVRSGKDCTVALQAAEIVVNAARR